MVANPEYIERDVGPNFGRENTRAKAWHERNRRKLGRKHTMENLPLSSRSLVLSAPRENVLFVPNRNVLLTRSGWGGERTRSSDHDPAGQRPTGSTQEGTQEADQTIAGGQGAERVGAPGAATASEPAPSQRSSDLPQGARLPPPFAF